MGVNVEIGAVLWGDDTLLLHGIVDLEFWTDNGRDLLLVASGAREAVTLLDMSDPGDPVIVDKIEYGPDSGTRALSDILVWNDEAGQYLITLGRYDDNYGYFSMEPGASFQDLTPLSGAGDVFSRGLLGEVMRFGPVSIIVTARHGTAGVQVYTATSGSNPEYLKTVEDTWWRTVGDVTAFDHVVLDGLTYVLAASAFDAGMIVFRVDFRGNFFFRSRILPTDSDGFAGITDIDHVTVGDRNFIILAGAESDSLSVIRYWGNLGLKHIDHFTDTNETRLAGVQTIEVFKIGDRAFIVAGGADDGISIFELNERGRLKHVTTIADDFGTSLANVSELAVKVDGETAHIFVASGSEHGLTELVVDLSLSGQVFRGGAQPDVIVGTNGDDIIWGNGRSDVLRGRAGDDRLVDGTGRDKLYGGSGADIFEFKADGRSDRIMDFEIGVDRIDLSDWDRIYHVDDVDIRARQNGAVIFIEDDIIRLTNPDGGPFDVDLFTQNDFIFG